MLEKKRESVRESGRGPPKEKDKRVAFTQPASRLAMAHPRQLYASNHSEHKRRAKSSQKTSEIIEEGRVARTRKQKKRTKESST